MDNVDFDIFVAEVIQLPEFYLHFIAAVYGLNWTKLAEVTGKMRAVAWTRWILKFFVAEVNQLPDLNLHLMSLPFMDRIERNLQHRQCRF